jgi:16S rRNA (uracil1498-N3)-methyltransferase
MRMHRFFLAGSLADQQEVQVTDDLFRYMGRVLRLTAGAEVMVFDGSGAQWPAVITALARSQLTLRLGTASHPACESPLPIRLMQAVSRGDRMDFAVQKASELGAREIQPVLARHGVVQLQGAQAARRMAHWQQVAVSACEQSGRTRPPAVSLPRDLPQALAELPVDGPRWILVAEAAHTLGADPAPATTDTITVLIGPEGGFSDDEQAMAVTHGFQPRRLGPRVLRTETAAVAVLAVLQSRWGDLAAD